MGLDAWLHSRRRNAPELTDDSTYDDYVEWRDENQVEHGYWRKANHIHRWFVDELADGVDECQSIPVNLEQLEGLRNLCDKVLSDRDQADKLLPTESGFFFGSTDYDEWYFEDIHQTISTIEKAMVFYRDEPLRMKDYQLCYQAWW